MLKYLVALRLDPVPEDQILRQDVGPFQTEHQLRPITSVPESILQDVCLTNRKSFNLLSPKRNIERCNGVYRL